MKKILVIFTLAVLALSLEGVQELTDADFEAHVYSEPKFWLVMFSASWVIHQLCSVDIALISNQKSKK